ncbi:MAG: endopeptidase La [Alphaproteobacteria bacterium]|nr:endopeptidase La [Rickettsiales bacterium]
MSQGSSDKKRPLTKNISGVSVAKLKNQNATKDSKQNNQVTSDRLKISSKQKEVKATKSLPAQEFMSKSRTLSKDNFDNVVQRVKVSKRKAENDKAKLDKGNHIGNAGNKTEQQGKKTQQLTVNKNRSKDSKPPSENKDRIVKNKEDMANLEKVLYEVGMLEKDTYSDKGITEADSVIKEMAKLQKSTKSKSDSNVLKEQVARGDVLKIPVLKLKDAVCFPNSITSLFIGREKSVIAIERSMTLHDNIIALVLEKTDSNVFTICSVAKILQKIKLPSGTTKLLVDIEYRGEIVELFDKILFLEAKIEISVDSEESENSVAVSILVRSVVEELKKYINLKKANPDSITEIISSTNAQSLFSNMVASFLQIEFTKKQSILEAINLEKRLEKILKILLEENEILELDQEIRDRVKMQVDKNQKEYYLNEQMKAIKKELGDSDGITETVARYEKLLVEKIFPLSVKSKIKEEIKRLKHSTTMFADSIRSYLDCVFSLPWGATTNEEVTIFEASKIIAESHYGLDKVKSTILEYIVAQIGQKKQKGAVLCLHGPPGVGKTTLVKSIAKAMGRKYAKISLGGVKDEAEIRGHRKTYIAAMPGRIIQTIKKVGVDNPVILLDEIDKMANDYRGDPESALLEVLDPEQNSSFQDNYLEIEYDLSKVIFIATANNMRIQRALLDRLEVVSIPSYLHSEKVSICKNYIIPKCLKDYGIPVGALKIEQKAIEEIIEFYTRESGVRELGRLISKIARKSLMRMMLGKEFVQQKIDSTFVGNIDNDSQVDNSDDEKRTIEACIDKIGVAELSKIAKIKVDNGKMVIGKTEIEYMFGARKYIDDDLERDSLIGIANGLAYTEVGGQVLIIEAVKVANGKGDIKLTGKLGDVMKESMQASLSYIKSKNTQFGIPLKDITKYDIHIHVPAGAVPKDGPSAGVTFCVVLVSLLSSRPVCQNVAMTGEISLRGKVLPIGGLREKIMAAKRSGIKKVLIPSKNKRDLSEIPDIIKEDVEIICCETLEDVLKEAICGDIDLINTLSPNLQHNDNINTTE